MPRPPALAEDASVPNSVDAEVCARAGSTIARRFSVAELPRLREAGGHEPSLIKGGSIEVQFQFSQFDGRPAVAGELHGAAVLTCQRCMQPVSIDIDDTFQVLIVDAERRDEPGGYEPVVAKASRLDLGWLAEEQVLLALPLVPMHEPGECSESDKDSASDDGDAVDGDDAGTRQQPFQNLRDLLRNK